MKKYSVFIPIFVFLLSFCKKKDKNPEEPTPTPQSQPLQGDMGTFVSEYNVYDYTVLGFGMAKDSSINASFYDSPYTTKTNIDAGTVTVNSTVLLKTASPLTYYRTNAINLRSLNWNISGSGTIAATSFSYVPNYPVYSGGNLLLDTAKKSTGFNISVASVSNYTGSVYLTIAQNTTCITATVSTFPSTVNITSSQISAFNTNDIFNIRLVMLNYSHITLNGNQYGINANTAYEKTVYLKP
jgi:hypothetical protein